MAAVDLALPAVADLDLPVAGTVAVADDEVVSQPVDHVADASVVDVKGACVSLAGAAVVDHDVFPATPFHRGMVDGIADRGGEIDIVFVRSEDPAPEPLMHRLGNGLETLLWLHSRFFDRDGRGWLRGVRQRKGGGGRGILGWRNGGRRHPCGCDWRGLMALRRERRGCRVGRVTRFRGAAMLAGGRAGVFFLLCSGGMFPHGGSRGGFFLGRGA